MPCDRLISIVNNIFQLRCYVEQEETAEKKPKSCMKDQRADRERELPTKYKINRRANNSRRNKNANGSMKNGIGIESKQLYKRWCRNERRQSM